MGSHRRYLLVDLECRHDPRRGSLVDDQNTCQDYTKTETKEERLVVICSNRLKQQRIVKMPVTMVYFPIARPSVALLYARPLA